jgi:hypothetical protein
MEKNCSGEFPAIMGKDKVGTMPVLPATSVIKSDNGG